MARCLRHRASLHVFPLSVGVRALVEDGDGSILLVRHTYVGGWHFPGGVEIEATTLGAAQEPRQETSLGALAIHYIVRDLLALSE